MRSRFPPSIAEPGNNARSLELQLGDFGWDAVIAAAGASRAADLFVEEACAAFGRKLFGSAMSLQAPHLARREESPRTVAISLPSRLWQDLQLEAGRQDVALERLVEHAVILHLAAR